MMLMAVQTILALCLLRTVVAAPQQDSITRRGCGSYAAVSGKSDGSSLQSHLGGMASLYNSTTIFQSSTHVCGAALLSDRYLLTAAHCVADKDGSFGITVGRDNINEKQRNDDNEYAIQEVFIHPSYDAASNEYNDIALLMTDRKIKFTSKIWPFCLPDANKVYDDYRLMQIAGWGEVSQDNRASDLQTAYVHIILNSRCESLWRRNTKLYNEFGESAYPQGITNQIVCAGREGVDACRGDSGGPLADTDKEGLTSVVGIIAKRTGCPHTPEPPGLYTNTAAYLDWIYETTGIPQPNAQTSTPTGTEPVSEVTEATTLRHLIFTTEISHAQNEPVIPVIPTKDECGSSLSNNVVAGESTDRGSWPWLAAIGRMNGASFVPFCGGTLITKQHVISAAHCFKSKDSRRIIVRLGEHNINEDEDGALDFRILDSRKARHNTYTKENDIILLKLDRPIKAFTDSIRAACLPFELPTDKLEGQILTVVGWGVFDNDRNDTISPVPLMGHIPVVPVHECQQKYDNKINIDDRQICAGRGGTDSCKGDSGGPLNYLDTKTSRFYLVGVVSLGPKFCGSKSLPGVYTRVTHYLPWIQNAIREMNENKAFDERYGF